MAYAVATRLISEHPVFEEHLLASVAFDFSILFDILGRRFVEHLKPLSFFNPSFIHSFLSDLIHVILICILPFGLGIILICSIIGSYSLAIVGWSLSGWSLPIVSGVVCIGSRSTTSHSPIPITSIRIFGTLSGQLGSVLE